VHHHQPPVGGKLDVELDPVGTLSYRLMERSKRVFRKRMSLARLPGAAVSYVRRRCQRLDPFANDHIRRPPIVVIIATTRRCEQPDTEQRTDPKTIAPRMNPSLL
jgi:hypothetical protein